MLQDAQKPDQPIHFIFHFSEQTDKYHQNKSPIVIPNAKSFFLNLLHPHFSPIYLTSNLFNACFNIIKQRVVVRWCLLRFDEPELK